MCGRGHGRGRGRDHGRGRIHRYGYGRGRGNYGVQFKNTGTTCKREEMGDKDKSEMVETKNDCHRCGGRNH